jgi:Kef-type K+ transport system membrane component KefB
VTLLLLGGLAIGPAGFSLLPESFLDEWFPPLTSIALALIGFLLGQQISVTELKERGSTVVGISICKVFGAWLAVGLALLVVGVVMMAFAGVLIGDSTVSSGITAGITEIGGSIALGFALGLPMAFLTGRIRGGEPTLAEGLGFILLGAGTAEWLGLSPILTAMTMGGAVASLAKHHERPFHAIEGIEWPFMILFFVLAGASLEVGALRMVGGIAAVYILARGVGIYIGTRSGGRLMGFSPPLRKWLGVALFPQAGVAIGMALLASQRFPEVASIILPVVLASTIFLEIVAPVITRQALRVAGAFEASNAES